MGRRYPCQIFRRYDIRGRVGPEITPGFARSLGLAFGQVAREHGHRRVHVGLDIRRSSLELARALCGGINASGLDVLSTGVVPTPVLYHACHLDQQGAGIMVTGSHNPPEYNGFKLVLGPGTLHGEAILDIGRRMEGDLHDDGSGRMMERDHLPAYMTDLCGMLSGAGRGLRVVVDGGNGGAGEVTANLLEAIGAHVIPIHCRPDPAFPNHHPDPSKPENLVDLREQVRARGADLGVALDGDGDRLGVVDEDGRVILGDQLAAIFWGEILPYHPGAVGLVEVKCSLSVVDEIRRLGGVPRFTATGHSLIRARMRELGSPFAGEMSGHFFFADEYYGFDDATYAAGRLCRLLSRSGASLSSLVGRLPAYHSTPEFRVAVPDDLKNDVVARAAADFGARYPVIGVDGARVQFPGGWGLVRQSNTEPAVVVRCEGRTAGDLELACREMSLVLGRSGLDIEIDPGGGAGDPGHQGGDPGSGTGNQVPSRHQGGTQGDDPAS